MTRVLQRPNPDNRVQTRANRQPTRAKQPSSAMKNRLSERAQNPILHIQAWRTSDHLSRTASQFPHLPGSIERQKVARIMTAYDENPGDFAKSDPHTLRPSMDTA